MENQAGEVGESENSQIQKRPSKYRSAELLTVRVQAPYNDRNSTMNIKKYLGILIILSSPMRRILGSVFWPPEICRTHRTRTLSIVVFSRNPQARILPS